MLQAGARCTGLEAGTGTQILALIPNPIVSKSEPRKWEHQYEVRICSLRELIKSGHCLVREPQNLRLSDMALFLATPFMHSLWIVVRRFGAFAFFPLGLLDMSVVPAPGSFDALLIVLTASHKELWWYYALMATAASVLGAWPSFQIGRKGGEEALEKKLGVRRSKKIFAAFHRWGFWSMFIGAVAPPPMPASAFVLTAGALKYPWQKFLLSWTLGRLLRFGFVGWIAARYGAHIFQWFRGYYRPALWIVGAFGVAGGAVALWFYIRERRRRTSKALNQQRRTA